jgi:thioesterase domain-containing protein
MGGTVAYEVAQQLRARGEEVALLAMFDTLNWNRLPSLNFWQKTNFAFEKVVFHALNFVHLDGGGKKSFLQEKFQALRNRIPVWRGMLADRLAGNAAETRSKSLVLGRIWAANDKASAAYNAKPYPGLVTDFRPLKQYSIYHQNELKWEELAQKGQKVVALPVYPAGMLVEPFVKALATALRLSIDATLPRSR